MNLVKIVVVLNILTVFGVVVHRQGPIHKNMAVGCLEEIIDKQFHFQYGMSDENRTLLFSVIISENLTSPAFEIQEMVLRKIHSLAKEYLVETISSGQRYEFQSFTDCSDDAGGKNDGGCVNNFIIDIKSNFYVIIVDSELNLDRSIKTLEQTNTFNTKALYLVYIESGLKDYERVAKNILLKMGSALLFRTAVLVPVTLQNFYLYKLSTATRGPYPCGSNVSMAIVDRCVKGQMENSDQSYYAKQSITNYFNCTMGVISIPQGPFVIDENRGFEIDVLKNVGRILNIKFNITQTNESQFYNWGHKDENGNWTGKLKLIYDEYYIGIGNIDYGMPAAQNDFSFSRYYYMEELVYVVPIAEFVPKWRVLVAIFAVEMWGICLGITVGFAICFFLTSKLGKEKRNFSLPGESFLSSFQIMISHAVFQHPISELTRVFFLSLSIWSIIISSAYTCSLVYYLTNPIREHQPTRNEEFLDVFGNIKYEMGGVSRYRQLFNSTNKDASKVFKIYQTATGENDTVSYWINQVGQRRNIWTISSKLYANYLLSKGHSLATHPNGKPKVFVFRRKLMAYSVCMLTRKGHPLLRSINYVIRKLVWGGIVSHWVAKYKHDNRDTGGDEKMPLSIDHLQGAFALLLLGYLFGGVIFIGEWVVKRLRKGKKKVRQGKIITKKTR